jgi:hypothetical protein
MQTPWTSSRAELTMKESADAERQAERPPLEILLEQRRRIEGWLERLGGQGSDVPSHIANRVRADYRERLERLTEELSSNREALELELKERETVLEQAEEQLATARERLDEARLRHAVGEYDAEIWSELRSELEQAVAAAEEEARIAAEEADRVRGALAAMGTGPAPEPAPPTSKNEEVTADEGARRQQARDEADAWEPEFGPGALMDEEPSPAPETGDELLAGEQDDAPAGGEEEEALPWLELPVDEPSAREESPAADPGEPEEIAAGEEVAAEGATGSEKGHGAAAADAEVEPEDLDFLRDLDRALSSSPTRGSPPPPAPSPVAQGSSERLSCPECGASNDARAWYCEICGTELS